MRNIDLYGIQKVNTELKMRAAVLEQIPSIGEQTARMAAWHSFVSDLIQLDCSNERVSNLARIKYQEAQMLCEEANTEMNIDIKKFTQFFFDELSVINRKVTKAGIQIAFYIVIGLGILGIYKLFF